MSRYELTKFSFKFSKYHKNSAWQKLEHLTPLHHQQDVDTLSGTMQPTSLQCKRRVMLLLTEAAEC